MDPDPNRYGVHHQGWENNSALEGYGAVHDPNFRSNGAYDDSRYPREYSQQGGALYQQSRRRNYEDEYSRRSEKAYVDLDSFHQPDKYHENERYQEYDDKFRNNHSSIDKYNDHKFDRPARYGDDYDHRSRREESFEEGEFDDRGRYSYDDSDYERTNTRREGNNNNYKRRESRDRRDLSRERDQSPPYRRNTRSSISRSRSRDDRVRSRSRSRSRSPRNRSYRDQSYEDIQYDRRVERENRHYREHLSDTPSATIVVKGLSLKTTEEDLYSFLTEWGPLRHVRIIRERNSGISRGFAFIDFPSVEAAQAMMKQVVHEAHIIDDRKLIFEYSSKPTGGPDSTSRGYGGPHRGITVPPSDWMCNICDCVNFARRTSCFQCNEPRTDDSLPADMGSLYPGPYGRRGESGPTHVLVVRGLDENADDDMLRYEFSKYAPIKDIRLVRDKFTHVSRGFAFVYFYSVEDATKALEATNGTSLEKNGQILRVAYAKSVVGPGSGGSQSSLAAAAIEAATFAQQYDAIGWAPKEYNPDEKQSNTSAPQEQSSEAAINQNNTSAPHSSFVWDEASGYYYDSSSGFYYDGNTGLYYDGNNGIWYSYDNQSQQYIPSIDEKEKTEKTENAKKVVISAPAATINNNTEKVASLHDAVQAAAAAAAAAEKKEKERVKEIKLASKSSLLASKKKMSNVLTMWKQRSHETQPPRVATTDVVEEKPTNVGHSSKNKVSSASVSDSDLQDRPPKTGGIVTGVIRSSGIGVVKSNTLYSGSSENVVSSSEGSTNVTPSMLVSYAAPPGSKRRFSEVPMMYRDRAAERRSLYGSTTNVGDDMSDHADSSRDSSFRRGGNDTMPFPPGVGGGRGEAVSESYEVITADKAIDESNVGNRMLRNMGWQEGLGLGKDGSGMVEPVQAQASENRAGLGSQPKKLDPKLEAVLPYLKSKLYAIYNKEREAALQATLWGQGDERFDNESGASNGSDERGTMKRIRKFISSCYPWLHAGNEGLLFSYQLLYLLDATGFYSLGLHALGIHVCRATGQELMDTSSRISKIRSLERERLRGPPWLKAIQGAFLSGTYAVLDYAQTGLIASVFIFKMMEWWYQSAEERMSAPTVYPPPPPPPPPKVAKQGIPLPLDKSLCALCSQKRANPSVLTLSGYVFCYSCIFKYVSQYKRCPVTLMSASVDEIRRLFHDV